MLEVGRAAGAASDRVRTHSSLVGGACMSCFSRLLAIMVLGLGRISFGAQAAEFDLSTATIADMQAAMDSGALTSEKLVQLYLQRIARYDQQGPRLNAVLTLNKNALEQARALDVERRSKGPRS